MSLGADLRRLRGAVGLQQNEVAAKLGVSRVTVSNWETGKTVPAEENLAALAVLYGVSKRALRYGPDNGVSPVSESAADPYVPNTEYRSELPPRVYEALLGYLGRLERLGLTHEQIARLETTLANTRYAQRFRRQGRPLTEDEQLELLDATWDAIAETLATQGRRP